MTKLVESLSEFDEVRFSAYRTGMKLRHIQKSLHLDCITFDNLSICLNSIPTIKLGKHFPSSSSSPSSPMKQERMDESISKLSTNNTLLSGSSFDGTPTSSLDRTKSFRRGEQLVGVIEIAACLRMCFESLHFSTPASAKENKDPDKSTEHNIFDLSNVNVPLSMDLVLNWLLNVYDSSRTGMIRLTSLKTALVLMCKGSLDDKYKFLFKLSSNDEGLVDRTRMTRLLKDCLFLPKQLGEVASFGGTNVEPSVTSCFDKSGNKTSISEKDFLNWMKLEPQSLVWIPVMQRLKSAEEAQHHVKCHCCKQLPLRGLRYRCLKCFSYDLCQKCFFAGKTSKNHKLSHPMQEYSCETTSSENVRDFTKVFKNKFRSKRYFQKHRRIGYLPVNASAECGLDADDDDDDDDVEESSPQNTVDDSTLLQRGIKNLTLKSQSEVFGPNLDGFADEHNLIAQYCKSLKGSSDDVEPSSPLQILKKLDAERKEEVEEMIRDLENENKNLKAEYERLLRIKGLPGRSRNGWSNHGNRSTHGSADDDVRRIEERLQVQDENNHHLQAELSQLQGGSLGEIRSTSMSSSSSFPKSNVSKVYTDNGVRELELDRMLQKLQTDDLPVNPGEANVSSLFREVEQINRAVETLVDIMTEGEDLRDRTNKLSVEKGGAKFNKSE